MKNGILPVFPGEKGPLLFGHRGYSALAPENTLPAFELLLSHSIPGVELDIRLCASGEVVVCHDDNLKRLTGSEINLSETDYSRIRTLDAGNGFSEKFRNTRIPLLEEVFELLGGRVYYDIEIKSSSKKTGIIEKKAIAMIERFGLAERCFISSFNPYSLIAAKREAPYIKTAVIYSRSRALPWYLRHGEGRVLSRCDIVKPEYPIISPLSLFLRKRIGGFPIIAWTVDTKETAERLIKMGTGGIISNNPAFIDIEDS